MSKRTLFASIACGLIAIAVQPLSAATPSLTGSWHVYFDGYIAYPGRSDPWPRDVHRGRFGD